jgi:hypothetical protein
MGGVARRTVLHARDLRNLGEGLAWSPSVEAMLTQKLQPETTRLEDYAKGHLVSGARPLI